MSPISNLYDGRLALIYWTPRSVLETSIAELADNIRANAPNVNAVCIKTNNGIGWQGAYDSTKPNLAINSIDDVRRWVDVLASRNLECHAWGVVRGTVPGQEADRFAQICLQSGVRSMLLDLESGPSYFTGDQNAAQQLAVGLRQRVGPDFHLGLIFDARGTHPQLLWVQSIWFPEVDSLHPMVYHYHFGVSAAAALSNCYNAIGNWGKPVYPMLQGYTPDGYPTFSASEIPAAANTAINNHRTAGFTIYRYGRGLAVIDGVGKDELSEVAKINLAAGPVVEPPSPPLPPVVIVPPPPVPAEAPPATVIVDPDNERTGEFTLGYYGDPEQLGTGWSLDTDVNGRPYIYRAALYNNQMLYVGYTPRLIGRGTYAIEVFVPGAHAYARDVYYVLVDYPGGMRREVTAVLDQSLYHDQWVSLSGSIINGQPGGPLVSQFELDPEQPDVGRVNVADVTFVDPRTHASGKFEIAYGAIRWRPVTAAPPEVATFDSPVGTEAERAGPFATGRLIGSAPVWVGNWYDANVFGARYLMSTYARHTGADLNLSGPGGVLADKDAPVYAIADGVVTFAGFLSTGWKSVIVIEHPVPNESRVVYGRYAHVANLQVRTGDVVRRGQPLATIGEYAPNNYHLHFDIATDPVLKTVPGHWPGDDLAAVQRSYVDPKEFIKQRHVTR